MHHSYKNKINPWVQWTYFPTSLQKRSRIFFQDVVNIQAPLSHTAGDCLFYWNIVRSMGVLENMNLRKRLFSRVKEFYKKRRIKKIQKQLFKKIFKEKDSYVGVYGTDERRPEVAVPPKPDKHSQEFYKYGFAEWLQFDVMALTEFNETLQKAGIVKKPERLTIGDGNFSSFLVGKNIHASGGPVPNKITAEIMKKNFLYVLICLILFTPYVL